ncbi:MAG: recombination regulator RecX [Congregibacter sp.]|nr:recombination regulator RecX [Congregibacter sp.]
MKRSPQSTQSPGQVQSPRNAAMNLLARREHSVLELQRKLGRRFDADALNNALQKLADEDLQSDERFAHSFTRERMLRGMGPLRIEAELRQRGVASAFIDDALITAPQEEGLTWRGVASDVLLRKFGDARPEDLPEKARRLRFLSYRGFGEEAAGLVPDVF